MLSPFAPFCPNPLESGLATGECKIRIYWLYFHFYIKFVLPDDQIGIYMAIHNRIIYLYHTLIFSDMFTLILLN